MRPGIVNRKLLGQAKKATMTISPDVIAAAQASHKKWWPIGPFVSVSLAQYGLESGWGKYPSGQNNFWGIKANAAQIAAGAYTNRSTEEQHASGQRYKIIAPFANYDTLEDGFDAHATLLTSPHYEACKQARTPEDYCHALKVCGYATAINYPSSLINIITQSGLKKYDQAF